MNSAIAIINNCKKFFIASTDEKKVDFLICGTQKAGTSTLDAYLREHPEICMAQNKEIHFFDNETYFCSNKPDYSKYHACFNPEPTHKLLGEATPRYMYWHDAPKRIWQYNPKMKIIIILRNPISRAYSNWHMERSRHKENLSFWDAINKEQERCREALPFQHKVYSYIDKGFYLTQLRRIWRYFPQDQVLILKKECLRDKPRDTLNKLYDFLDVSHKEYIKIKNVRSQPYESTISIREKEYLRSIFEYEIKNIERVLGWDCSDWLKG